MAASLYEDPVDGPSVAYPPRSRREGLLRRPCTAVCTLSLVGSECGARTAGLGLSEDLLIAV